MMYNIFHLKKEFTNGTNKFIQQVLSNETSLEVDNEFFKDVSSILERKERLTENNIIIGSSLTINRNTQESFLDEDFSQLRVKLEMVGNLFNEILNLMQITFAVLTMFGIYLARLNISKSEIKQN